MLTRGRPVTFKTVAQASLFSNQGEDLKPIDGPDDHEHAKFSEPSRYPRGSK
jgi:hypothetical protein